METQIISSLISAFGTVLVGLLAFMGVVFTNRKTGEKIHAELEKHQAVTDTKIDELTREVREHNNFARRVPVLEEQQKVINHRLCDLEEYNKIRRDFA